MLTEWISGKLFQFVHRSNLVYNCCWEDPRIDRAALQLQASDKLLVITSAGCNALDYAISGISEIHAVDMNFRQNALLDLKVAGIRKLDFGDFFEIFGRGRLGAFERLYHDSLRGELSPTSKEFWDKRAGFFSGNGRSSSFYYRGTSGAFARAMRAYIDRKPVLRAAIDDLFQAESIQQQSAIYESVRPHFWTKMIRWILGRDSTMALLGVPRAQRQHVEHHYPGGIAKFIEDCVEYVFAKLPLHDNYFWRLYVYGQYTLDCCPEYLKESNFQLLKNGLVNSISTHTCTVTEFLRQYDSQISKFVLLDHMDWLNTAARLPLLTEEWQSIVDHAADDTRIIWRSGGLDGRFVDSIRVKHGGVRQRVGELLNYYPEQATALHARDRVHTYGSFCIADFSPTRTSNATRSVSAGLC